MSCNYCTPNKYGKRKALGFNCYPLRDVYGGPSIDRYKKETLRINRKQNKKKTYFIGVHTIDVMADGTMLRNNGFKFQKEINFCPMCGRDLKEKKATSGN